MSEFKPIQFVDTDAQRIQQKLISGFEQTTGQVLYPGDPRRVFLLQLMPVIIGMLNDINYTGNQNLLPFASGDVLDALGVRVGVQRLQAQSAKTTVRFMLSAIQLNTVTIPRGTRVTPDGVMYFATKNDLNIMPGETKGDIIAESIQGGEQYNGFVAGQINIIVDPIPFVASAANIDTSSGGSGREDDDSYRERQRLAPASFSVAGPEDAYVYWAKSADVNIGDISVTSPSDCVVNIYVLMKNGQLPTQHVLDKVNDSVSPKDRRPLTDHVQAFSAVEVNYDINLTYYISKERSTEVASIRAAIENTSGAVDQYESWQRAKLGRAINPDMLRSMMYAAGAFRVVTTLPSYAEIRKNEAAFLGKKNIVYGGLI
ncbi:baseplate J/gp47 family protein [Paenibacillus albiflavus]|uniref:Baseplate J/gp47 family protein n=1 Tax=Paenibacillus albiflavus TaxID=2545760 RepID=A0A4R4E2Q1_9BACL|nr:baseplate J/gp47 family protein [Paenibacillus albiflavus]TCZ73063.1 baseplate J/gp47 family protein [Paenibacillus albiflavus]